MSTSYSIYVRIDQPHELVVRGLQEIVGRPLIEVVNRRTYFTAKVLGVEISLVYPIPYQDDVIAYSKYSYEIMIEYDGSFDSTYSNSYRKIISIVLAEMVSRHFNCECLAVEGSGDLVNAHFFPI